MKLSVDIKIYTDMDPIAVGDRLTVRITSEGFQFFPEIKYLSPKAAQRVCDLLDYHMKTPDLMKQIEDQKRGD